MRVAPLVLICLGCISIIPQFQGLYDETKKLVHGDCKNHFKNFNKYIESWGRLASCSVLNSSPKAHAHAPLGVHKRDTVIIASGLM